MTLLPSRRLAAALAALAMAVPGTAAASIPDDAALPDDALAATRLQGQDRYGTAARTAVDSRPDGANVAVLARGDAFPDGLAASTLAGANNAPILLTEPNRLPLITQDAFDRLGTQRVVIVGGPSAIGDNVEQRLNELFGDDDVSRLSGSDRFQTAAVISNELGTPGTLSDLSGQGRGQLRTAVLASGRSFPDALAAGPLANAAGLPILLTDKSTLPDVTRFALESGVQQVVVAGGPVTIDGAVVRRVRELDGIEVVHRVSGADRTATAVALGQLARAELGWPSSTTTVASGTDFPDALSLAPAAAAWQAPILLTRAPENAGGPTFAAVQRACAPIERLVVAGGDVALGAAAERQLELATSCADHAVTMTADQVVGGPGTADAAGDAVLWNDSLCYGVRVRDLGSPVRSLHIHVGGPDERGPVRARLATPDTDGFAAGCLADDDVEGDPDQLRTDLAQHPDQLYVDVHTDERRVGALRGQVATGG